MLTLSMCYDLCEREPLFGVPDWEVDQPHLKVLYLEKEIGVYRLRKRLEIMHNFRNGSLVTTNFFLIPKGTEHKEIGLSEQGIENIREHIIHCEPDILVIDPLRKFHESDEDSSTEMVKIIHRLDALQKEFRDLTTIIVHHTGKISDHRDGTDPQSFRGSSIIFDDADTAIVITKPNKKQAPNLIQLNFFLRSAEDPKPLFLTFDPTTFTFKHQ